MADSAPVALPLRSRKLDMDRTFAVTANIPYIMSEFIVNTTLPTISKKNKAKKKKNNKTTGGKKKKRHLWKAEAIQFSANTTLEVPFPFKSLTTTSLELRFKTLSSSGSLVSARGPGGDELLLTLEAGRLVLRWELGSGEGRLETGAGLRGGWHRVRVKRYHRDAQLTLDREPGLRGRAGGSHKSLNVGGSMVLGGLEGCVGGLKVGGKAVGMKGELKACGKSCEGGGSGSRCRKRQRRGRRRRKGRS